MGTGEARPSGAHRRSNDSAQAAACMAATCRSADRYSSDSRTARGHGSPGCKDGSEAAAGPSAPPPAPSRPGSLPARHGSWGGFSICQKWMTIPLDDFLRMGRNDVLGHVCHADNALGANSLSVETELDQDCAYLFDQCEVVCAVRLLAGAHGPRDPQCQLFRLRFLECADENFIAIHWNRHRFMRLKPIGRSAQTFNKFFTLHVLPPSSPAPRRAQGKIPIHRLAHGTRHKARSPPPTRRPRGDGRRGGRVASPRPRSRRRSSRLGPQRPPHERHDQPRDAAEKDGRQHYSPRTLARAARATLKALAALASLPGRSSPPDAMTTLSASSSSGAAAMRRASFNDGG